jgi:hypothetical protein
MNVVECPEFRTLLLYLQENLTDNDIPGRTKIRTTILQLWREEFLKLKTELQVRHLAMRRTPELLINGYVRKGFIRENFVYCRHLD